MLKTLSLAKEDVGIAVTVMRYHSADEQVFQEWLVSNYHIYKAYISMLLAA